jgi:hypothetical protein
MENSTSNPDRRKQIYRGLVDAHEHKEVFALPIAARSTVSLAHPGNKSAGIVMGTLGTLGTRPELRLGQGGSSTSCPSLDLSNLSNLRLFKKTIMIRHI